MSDNYILLNICFGAGVIFQLLVFTNIYEWNRNKLLKLAAIFIMAFISFFPWRGEYPYHFSFHLFGYFIVCAAAMLFAFKKEILPRVSKASLLSVCLIFWYALISRYGYDSIFNKAFFWAGIVPTAYILFVAFTLREWQFWPKFFFYICFLFLVAAIYIMQISFSDLQFISGMVESKQDLFMLFVTGMSFAYLTAACYFVFILIPIPGKTKEQTEENIMAVVENAELMASYFVDYRMTPLRAFIVIAVQGGMYVTAVIYKWAMPSIVISVSLLVMFLALSILDLGEYLVSKKVWEKCKRKKGLIDG